MIFGAPWWRGKKAVDEDWERVGHGVSDGWRYEIYIKQVGDKYAVRIQPGNHPWKKSDDLFDALDKAKAAGVLLAESAIREIRNAEGYPAE